MAKKLENKRSIKKISDINAYKEVFGGEAGKTVLHDLMKSTYFLETTFDANPQIAAFNEGRRSLVTHIMSILKIDTKQLYNQMKEQEEIEKMYNA